MLARLALSPDAAATDGDPGEPEAVAVDLVGGAAVLLDVLVAAVLVREAAQEGRARQAARDVVNTVFAFSGLAVCGRWRSRVTFRAGGLRRVGHFSVEEEEEVD